jgi:hypothetical protein
MSKSLIESENQSQAISDTTTAEDTVIEAQSKSIVDESFEQEELNVSTTRASRNKTPKKVEEVGSVNAKKRISNAVPVVSEEGVGRNTRRSKSVANTGVNEPVEYEPPAKIAKGSVRTTLTVATPPPPTRSSARSLSSRNSNIEQQVDGKKSTLDVVSKSGTLRASSAPKKEVLRASNRK